MRRISLLFFLALVLVINTYSAFAQQCVPQQVSKRCLLSSTGQALGNVDGVTCDILWGWGCGMNTDCYDCGSQFTTVHIYADAPAAPGRGPIAVYTANNQFRPDVAPVCSGTNYHGFSVPFPAQLRDGQLHTLYVYSVAQAGFKPILEGFQVRCSAPVQPTNTPTQVPPTSTPVPPTRTPVPPPTNTPVIPTNTPIPPPTNTIVPSPTWTSLPTPTVAAPTATPYPTSTPTPKTGQQTNPQLDYDGTCTRQGDTGLVRLDGYGCLGLNNLSGYKISLFFNQTVNAQYNFLGDATLGQPVSGTGLSVCGANSGWTFTVPTYFVDASKPANIGVDITRLSDGYPLKTVRKTIFCPAAPPATSTATATQTAVATATSTSTPTATKTASPTVTPSPTCTLSPTLTRTAIPTVATQTPTPTMTATPTCTVSNTATATPTPAKTKTATPVPTSTATSTATVKPPCSRCGRVTPLGQCVRVQQGSSGTVLIGEFGYTNDTGTTVQIALGDNNFVTPRDRDQIQPTTFVPGTVARAFSLPFSPTGAVTWSLNGAQATLQASDPRCAEVQSFTSKSCIEQDLTNTITAVQQLAIKQKQLLVSNLKLITNKSGVSKYVSSQMTTSGISGSADTMSTDKGYLFSVYGTPPKTLLCEDNSGCSVVDKNVELEKVQQQSTDTMRLMQMVIAQQMKLGRSETSRQRTVSKARSYDVQIKKLAVSLPRFVSSCGQ